MSFQFQPPPRHHYAVTRAQQNARASAGYSTEASASVAENSATVDSSAQPLPRSPSHTSRLSVSTLAVPLTPGIEINSPTSPARPSPGLETPQTVESAASPLLSPDIRGALPRSNSWGSVASSVSELSAEDEEDEQQAIAVALEELEDLQIAEFLSRTSKFLDEVRLESQSAEIVLPPLSRFRDRDGTTQWSSFLTAYSQAFADKYLPSDMIEPEISPQKFSLTSSHTRGSIEKFYISIKPSALSGVFSKIKRIYDWEDPHTKHWAALYFFCWVYDLVPCLLCGIFIYIAAKRKLDPPSASRVRQQVREERARAKEAKALNEELKRRAELGFLGNSLLGTIGTAALMSSATVGKVDGLASRSSPTATPSKIEEELNSSGRGSKHGIFRLAKDISSRFGPDVLVMMDDASDLVEKLKNHCIWRDRAASERLMLGHGFLFLFLLMASPRVIGKIIFGYIGFAFFCLFRLQDKYPKYRRVVNPAFWFLLGIPTDAEASLQVLKDRAAKGKPIMTSSDLKRLRKKNRSSISGDDTASLVSTEEPGPKAKLRDLFEKGRDSVLRSRSPARSPASPLASRTSSDVEDDDQPLYFAFWKGTPGALVLDDRALRFDAMKGFHTLTTSIEEIFSRNKYKLPSPEISSSDCRKSRTVLSIQFSDIVGVKKIDNSGLLVTLKLDDPIKFLQVAKRDKLFSRLLTIPAKDWRTI